MKQRSEYRVGDITAKPGVYIFRDELRQVIYVGKAKIIAQAPVLLLSALSPAYGRPQTTLVD